jgi:hypothetical protein
MKHFIQYDRQRKFFKNSSVSIFYPNSSPFTVLKDRIAGNLPWVRVAFLGLLLIWLSGIWMPAIAMGVTTNTDKSGNQSAPECNLLVSPRFCKWTKEKLVQSENDRVTVLSRRFTKATSTIKIKKLLGGYYLPGDDPQYAAFCNAALKQIEARNFELFPQPEVKSSADGYKSFGRKWIEIVKEQKCSEGEIDRSKKYAAGVRTSNNGLFKSNTAWLYKTSNGYTAVSFDQFSHNISAQSSVYNCQRGNSVLASYPTKTQAENSFAVLRLAGDLFLAETGVRYWTNDELKFDPYQQLWLTDTPENDTCNDKGKCKTKFFSLIPVGSPPWDAILKQRQPNVSNQEFYGRVDQVCLWWIE